MTDQERGGEPLPSVDRTAAELAAGPQDASLVEGPFPSRDVLLGAADAFQRSDAAGARPGARRDRRLVVARRLLDHPLDAETARRPPAPADGEGHDDGR